MFKHDFRDFILVFLSIAQLVINIFAVSYFDILATNTLFILAAVQIILICTNFQCVAHNFIHNTFFKSDFLNGIFSISNTLSLGMPQSTYKVHHTNHHTYNNDNWDNENPPLDKSSIFYFGKDKQPEHVLAYTFLSYFRLDLVRLFIMARKRDNALVILETLLLIATVAYLLISHTYAFFCFILPVYYLGTSFASYENYMEHYGADNSSRLNDSISCYNKIYNFIWFNNGFHQEHHWKPSTHWTKIPSVEPEMLNISERTVAPVAHIFGAKKP
jgi:fatty acid desaturase